MALRGVQASTVPTEVKKEQDRATIRNFFEGQRRDDDLFVKQKQDETKHEEGVLQTRRLMFDPPEDLQRFPPPVDGFDSKLRVTMLQRADAIVRKAENISIKEATSLQQRRAKEEATYLSFEEIHNQQTEIFEAKRLMELHPQESNYSKIHTLLFGPKPDDVSPLGDWDVYHKVQEQIRTFAYRRAPNESAGTAETTQQLNERLNQSREQLEQQRVRIRDLSMSLKSSATEIAGLKALLQEKNDELVSVKQKNGLLHAQLKHLKDSQASSYGARRQSTSTLAKDATPNAELLSDFQQLVAANLQLEQENVLLRARVAARGQQSDLKDVKSLLPAAQSSTEASDFVDKQRRQQVLRKILPSSSAVLQLTKARQSWLRRHQRSSCDALAGHDIDANIELIEKPVFDAKKRPLLPNTMKPAIAVRILPKAADVAVRDVPQAHTVESHDVRPHKVQQAPQQQHQDVPRNETAASQSLPAAALKSRSRSPSVQPAAQPAVISHTGPSTVIVDEPGDVSRRSDEPLQHLWHAIRTKLLGAAAVSRADCLRREAMHLQKMRQRVAHLSEELSRVSSERSGALLRCEKAECELTDSKAAIQELASRCEKLNKIVEELEEEKHRSALEPRSHNFLVSSPRQVDGRLAARRGVVETPQSIPPSNRNESNYETLSRALQMKLETVTTLMESKISQLEAELEDTKNELHATQAKLIRDGIFYNTTAQQQQQPAEPATTRLQESACGPLPQEPKLTASKKRMERDDVDDAMMIKRQLAHAATSDDDEDDLPAPKLHLPDLPKDSQEASEKVKALQRELCMANAEMIRQGQELAAALTKLRVASEQQAQLLGAQTLSLREAVAQRVIPRVMRWLTRARRRLEVSQDVPQPLPPASLLEEDDQIVEDMRQFVERDSAAEVLILRQRELRNRVNAYAPSAIGSQEPVKRSALGELRVQWLRLVMLRETQLKSSTTAFTKRVLSDLLRETYAGLMECEHLCAGVPEDALCCAAAKDVLERTSKDVVDATVISDMADVRSSEQLERERLAQAELKRSLLQLARDIEVKKAEVAAADAEVAEAVFLAPPNQTEHRQSALFFAHECTGSETSADAFALFGVLTTSDAGHSEPLPDTAASRVWKVPIFSASAAETFAKSFNSVIFYARCCTEPQDSAASFAARFGVPLNCVVSSVTRSPLTDDVTPPTVDVRIPLDTVLTAFHAHRTVVVAEVSLRTSLRALGQFSNVSEDILVFHNAVLPPGHLVHVPCVFTDSNTRFLESWVAKRRVIARHTCTRHETSHSIALMYNVAPGDVHGQIGEGLPVSVTIPTVEALRHVVVSPALEAALKACGNRTRIKLESTTRLSSLAKSNQVSPLAFRIPNVRAKHLWPSPVECLVTCRTAEQIKFAVEKGHDVVSVSRLDHSVHYIATAQAALEAADVVCAIFSMPRWDPEVAAQYFNADPDTDVSLWDSDLDPNVCPTVDVVRNDSYDLHAVSFIYAHRALKCSASNPEKLQQIAKAFQQDAIEILTFAAVGCIHCCEVMHYDPGSGALHTRLLTSSQKSATDIKAALLSDGPVSTLAHLRAALLDYDIAVADSELNLFVDGNTVTLYPTSSQHFVHLVEGPESMQSIALHYGVRLATLLGANGAAWLRQESATSNRRSKRKVLLTDEAAPQPAPQTEVPLRRLQIATVKVPLPMELRSLRTVTVDEAASLLQLAGALGQRADRVFVPPSCGLLHVGNVLRIPPRSARRFPHLRNVVGEVLGASQFLVEGRGDTLASVCEHTGLSEREIMLENLNMVKVKQNTTVAVETRKRKPLRFVVEHAVAEHDTLTSLCERFNVAPQDILQANPTLLRSAACEGLLVPVLSEDKDALLDGRLTSLYTVAADVSDASLAKTFGCSVEDVAAINKAARVPDKKFVPLVSPGAVALVRRQQLPLLIAVGLGVTETLLTVAERFGCHISDIVKLGLPLRHFVQAVRVYVTAEVASRCAGVERVLVENVEPSRVDGRCPAPRVIEVATARDVSSIRARVEEQNQRKVKFSQKMHFFEDRVAEVSQRIAVVQRDLNVVEHAIFKQKSTGVFVEPEVLANRESTAVQTDATIEEVPEAERTQAVKVPHHARSTQTNLTGETVEHTLHSIEESHGKELLLQLELDEAKASAEQLTSKLEAAQLDLILQKSALDKVTLQCQSYKKQLEVTEKKGTDSTQAPPANNAGAEPPAPTVAMGNANAGKHVMFDAPATNMTTLQPPRDLRAVNSRDAASQCDEQYSQLKISESAQPKMTLQRQVQEARGTAISNNRVEPCTRLIDVGSQCKPDQSSKRVQTLPVAVTETEEIADDTKIQIDSCNSVEFAQLNRLVHVVEHSMRDNETAPKDPQRPVAIVFTDIESSTSLWQRAPDAMSDAVETHHQVIRSLIRDMSGYEVKTIGDSFMVAFDSIVNAVQFSLSLQTAFVAQYWPGEINRVYRELRSEKEKRPVAEDDTSIWNGIRVRVGMNFGKCTIRLDTVTHGYDYYGTLVNTAARVEGIGNGGQILLTGAAMEAMDAAALPPGTVVTSLGPQPLRGLNESITIFQLNPESLSRRVFDDLRIDRANEMSEEALAASFAPSQTNLSEAEARALRAEAAAARSAADAAAMLRSLETEAKNSEVALAVERQQSAANLAALRNLQEAVERKTAAEKNAVNRQERMPRPSVSLVESHNHEDRRNLSDVACRSRIALLRSELAAVKEQTVSGLLLHKAFVESLFRELLAWIGLRFEQQLLRQVTEVADHVTAAVRETIVREKLDALGHKEPAQNIPDDQRYALAQVSKHAAGLILSDTTRGSVEPDHITPTNVTYLPPQSQPRESLLPLLGAQRQEPAVAPMRRSTVSALVAGAPRDDPQKDTKAPLPPSPPPAERPLVVARPQNAVDTRSSRQSSDAALWRQQLSAKGTFRAADPTPPFSPPFTLKPGSTFAGLHVSHSAAQEMERVTIKVHKEVLAALRLDIPSEQPSSGHGAHPTINTMRSLTGTLNSLQVEAVQRFREEQEALGKEKRQRLLRRIATRYKAMTLMKSIERSGKNVEFLRFMWRNWMSNWDKHQRQLRAQERSNVERLVSALSSSAADTHREFAPFHTIHYQSPTTLLSSRTAKAPRQEALRPPTEARGVSSSSHFRFAQL